MLGTIQGAVAEDPLSTISGGRGWYEYIGLGMCLVFALGCAWADRHVLARGEDAPAPVAFSEVVECRVRSVITAQDEVALVKDSPSKERACAPVQVPLPETSLAQKSSTTQAEALLVGTPMVDMTESLTAYDTTTLGLALGIAKIESDWGRRAPHVSGADCYNYWGYKGVGARGSVAGGYACFGSPEEAVRTVVGKIDTLAHEGQRNTPEKMIVWKCGSSCAAHDPESVRRWIDRVDQYYRRVLAG
jgi:hypothetical protein